MVELHVANVVVAGSNPVSRSIFSHRVRRHRQAVRQRSAKSLSPVRIRVSPPYFSSGFVWTGLHNGFIRKGVQNDIRLKFFLVFLRALSGYFIFAGVVELVDTRDLKSLGLFVRAGSSPASGTIKTSLKRLVFYLGNITLLFPK